MLELNLFHEQQELQRQRDYDPVKLTILGGIVVILGILAWAGVIYLKSASVRVRLAENKRTFDKLEADLKALGDLTDLEKIRSQATSLHNRISNRVLMATQLDILRTAIPTNCQVREIKLARAIDITETTLPGRPNKPGITVRKVMPSADFLFTVVTRAKTKSDVLQIRDGLEESLHGEPQFRSWIQQVPMHEGDTNLWNEVVVLPTSKAQDPLGKDAAIGIFNFKMPFALKDEPRELQ